MKSNGEQGQVAVVVILVFLFLFGGLICLVTIPAFCTALRQLSWTQAACELQSIELKPEESLPTVRFRYEYRGDLRVSELFKLPTNVYESAEAIRTKIKGLAPGTTVPCWMDGSEPPIVVMERESLTVGIALIFPLVFVLIGIGYAVARRKAAYKTVSKVAARSKEDQGRSTIAVVGALCFFGLFILVGCVATYFTFFRPLLLARAMLEWTPMRCTMVESEIAAHVESDDSRRKAKRSSPRVSYSNEVKYEYTIDGRRYVGDDFNPAYPQLSDRQLAEEVRNRYPKGSTVDCFVDPKNPFQATLDKELPPRNWLGLIPSLFTFAGLLGLFVYFGGSIPRPATKSATGRVTGRASSRLKGIFGLLLVNIVWNGLVIGVGSAMYFELSKSYSAIFPLLILIPFVLVGIFLLAAIPYAVLQLFNPSLDVSYSPATPRSGESFTVSWNLNGSARRVRKLSLTLELIQSKTEKRRHGQSTSTHTSSTSILKVPVISVEREKGILKGNASVIVPELPTSAEIGRCRWELHSQLVIPWCPDASEVIKLGPVEFGEIEPDSDDDTP